MARASSTPKGASTPAGSLGKRQIGEAVARRKIAPLIEGFERLIAMGYQPPAASKVLLLGKNYLRDLASIRSLSPITLATAAGGKRVKARRAVNIQLLLDAKTFDGCLKHLARATPEEEAEIEAKLSDALDAQAAKRRAAEVKQDAFAHREGLAVDVERLTKAANTPALRRRAAVVAEFQAEAARAYAVTQAAFTKAGNVLRRHLGLPPARPGHANQSLQRIIKGHKRHPRWWNRRKGAKPAHGALNGLGLRFSEIGESARFYFAGHGAYTFGSTLAVTLNLDTDRSALALKSGRPAGWLLGRVRKELKAKLGRDVPVALAVELNAAGLVHAHMFLAGCTLAEASPITAALSRAGGSTYRGSRRQVDIKARAPDSGWASYGAKDILNPSSAFGDAHRIAISAELKDVAADLYAEVIAFVSNPGQQSVEAAEEQSALTANIGAENAVNFLTKALASPDLDRVALSCGHQREAEQCAERKLPLTGSRTCSRNWRIGRVPTLDTS